MMANSRFYPHNIRMTKGGAGQGGYLMALVLVDGLNGNNLIGGQVPCSTHDPKRAIPNHVEVAKGKGHRTVLSVAGRHRHWLVPHLLHYQRDG